VRLVPACLLAIVAAAGSARPLRADPAGDRAALEHQLAEIVRPFVATYCVGCHGAEKPKGDLDLTRYTGLDAVTAEQARWAEVLDRLATSDMPPEKAKRHPGDGERQAVVRWIQAMRRYEGQRHAGDPGVVLARRLSNAEYDYSIADLTGVDVRPTREFPVDPANEAGFDNSGESLGMSPALLKKYLEAARRVTEFLVLTPHGLEFAPHPVVADTDRDRYSVNRIIAFYGRQETDYARYFQVAWRWKHRAALGQRGTLASVAAEAKVSPRYLATIWKTLEAPHAAGPIRLVAGDVAAAAGAGSGRGPGGLRADARLRGGPAQEAGARGGEPRGRQGEQGLAAAPHVEEPAVGRQPPPLRSAPPHRRREGRRPDRPRRSAEPAPRRLRPVPARSSPMPSTSPSAGRTYADQESEKAKGRGGRLLSAGFHSMTGYFRDDAPLSELMLDDGPAARAGPAVGRLLLHERAGRAHAHQLPLVRALRTRAS
jgi:hypothetical protein